MVRNFHSLLAVYAVEESELDTRGDPQIIQLSQQAVYVEDVTALCHDGWCTTKPFYLADGTVIIAVYGSG